MSIDTAARTMLDFHAGKYSEYENGRWLVAYHEEQVYSVRDALRNTVTICKARSPGEAYCKAASVPVESKKPITMGDKIRAMTDENLAILLVNSCPPIACPTEKNEPVDLFHDCLRCWEKYLQQEAKG